MYCKDDSIANVLGIINPTYAPLKEEYYNCNNYGSYLSNEHFHHSDKGCQIEMVKSIISLRTNRMSINKQCHTHNTLCSKTGWELGWFSGTYNRGTGRIKNVKKTCQNCGVEYLASSGNNKYCPVCCITVGRTQARTFYKNNKNKIV